MIAQNNVEEIDYYKNNFKDLNIDIIINEDLQKTKECLAGLLGDKTPTEADLNWWRFSYWIERKRTFTFAVHKVHFWQIQPGLDTLNFFGVAG